MGWSCTIEADRDILEDDIQDVLKNMPHNLGTSYLYKEISRQSWGWSAKVDVWNPEGKEMRIGGSYSISGKFLETFRDEFIKLMEVKNYNLKYTMNW